MTTEQRDLMLKIAKDPGKVSTRDFSDAGLPLEAFLKYCQLPKEVAQHNAKLALLNQA